MSTPELPFQPHSTTSINAAHQAKAGAETQRAKVLAFLVGRGPKGATDDEMQGWLTMNPSTQRPRRIELVRKGYVLDSGRTRKTSSGRSATVWIAHGF